MALANMTPVVRDRALRDYWKNQYDFIDVKSATASYDADRGEHRLVMEGEARMDWSRDSYETDGTNVGYKADFRRDPGPDSDAPFAVAYPIYTRTVETILLPKGIGGFKIGSGAEVDRTIGGIAYYRHAAIKDNVFTVEKTERSLVPEFAARDAPAAQAALRGMAETMAYLQAPENYRPTGKDVAALMATTPATAAAFVTRGNDLMKRGRMDEAIADFDQAIKLEPKNALAFANRGIARAWKGDVAAANKDIDTAFAIDPREAVVFRARGLLAQQGSKPSEAVTAFTTALEIEPESVFALTNRAQAHRSLGNNDLALADSAAALKLAPGEVDIHLMRANLLRALGRDDEAVAEAAAVSAANPDNAYAQVAAARIYATYKRTDEAMKAFDRALAIKPEPYIFINRSEVRPKEDLTGRRADLDAAFRLDGTSPDVLQARARLLEETGDRQGAIRTWSTAIAAVPGEAGLLLARGLAYARADNAAMAEKDFASARAAASHPAEFNNMCWSKATAGVALQSALADCDAALSKRPEEASFLDSRGLVLLRLGRFDEALATYDRAIAKAPGLSSSLYGRAVVWARKGDKTKAAADAAAALRFDPDVKTAFDRYGLTI